MNTRRLSFLLTLLCCFALLLTAVQADVEEAIDRGVAYLRSEVEKDPWWHRNLAPAPAAGRRGGRGERGKRPRQVRYIMGKAAIETYALVVSNVSVDDPVVTKSFENLAKLDPREVYSVSLYLMALDAALGQIETDQALLGRTRVVRLSAKAQELRKRMKEMTRWLVKARHRGRGVWNYGPASYQGRYDNSNTQFAVLALGVAAKRGLPIAEGVWSEIARHFLETQQKNGSKVAKVGDWNPVPGREAGQTAVRKSPLMEARGWGYRGAGKGTLNMTAAGVSSLIIAREYQGKAGEFAGKEDERIRRAITDGVAWLAQSGLNYVDKHLYYGLYSVEKVGDLGAIKTIGDLDWYRHGSELLLRKQRADGSWGNPNQNQEHNYRYQTSFALLFLNRATDLLSRARPILTRAGSHEGQDGIWLYLPKLKGELSISRFFRKLQYRLRDDLLPLAESVLREAEKQGRLHNLVAPALELANSNNSRLQKFAQKCLEKATGERHRDVSEYSDWLAAWRKATRTGQEKDKSGIPELRKLLGQTKSLPLKHQILWAFERCMAVDAMPEMLVELEKGRTVDYRGRVYRAMKFISNQDFPYDPKAGLTTRKGQIAQWRKWYEDLGS